MSENKEVQKFDPSTLMQGVKDRIKATFVSLIPDDQWEVMVKKEVDAFFDPTTNYSKEVKIESSGYGGYNRNIFVSGETSVFRALVFELCFEKATNILRDKISHDYFKETFDRDKMDEGLKKIVEAAVPKAMNDFFNSVALGYMNQLRNDINSNRY